MSYRVSVELAVVPMQLPPPRSSHGLPGERLQGYA